MESAAASANYAGVNARKLKRFGGQEQELEFDPFFASQACLSSVLCQLRSTELSKFGSFFFW